MLTETKFTVKCTEQLYTPCNHDYLHHPQKFPHVTSRPSPQLLSDHCFEFYHRGLVLSIPVLHKLESYST